MTSFTPELFMALALFAFVSSITPGPNNMMLLASGANFGVRRTLPHLAGVSIGFCILVLCTGLGLGGLFKAFPILHDILQVAGGIYLVYLAYRIATAAGINGTAGSGRPQTFWQALAFQWVNPKAWAMAIAGVTSYAPRDHYVANVLVAAVVFSLVNGPCVAAWMTFGMAMRRVLGRPAVLRTFNLSMAALLLASLIPIVLERMGR